ncbi:MAG: HlyD family type I secretion periplasmic adaptor subunit [Hyphomicrobiales bacterium]|nr:HlyD family type I secretion periplasmic adaptor subunit [Hyphomicrobiales bacterium]
MNRLDQLLSRHPLPKWRVVAWPIIAFLASLLVWSVFARLDEVALAGGEVVPQGKVKVIQHLEGGIIDAILVHEGMRVRAGDPLVRLDLATVGVNREELQVRLDGERLKRARLIAELQHTPITFLPAAAARLPSLVSAEQEAYRARKAELSSSRAVIVQQVRQKELEVQELQSRKRAVSNNLKLARERLSMSQSLLSDGLTPRMEHLQLRAEVESLAGELRTLEQSVPRAQAAVSETKNRLDEIEKRFHRETQDALETTEHAIARLEQLLDAANDQDMRADIRSPIDGIVKKLRYHTIGGVVSPGDPIMEIVPVHDTLVIQAKLNPVDRGYVRPGQPALVKISTYDFVRYGGLEGTVVHVAPDSTTDQAGRTYFEVIVKTEKTDLGGPAGSLPISPGMQAIVDIHTGTKTVMEYLIKPVLKLRHEAFRER